MWKTTKISNLKTYLILLTVEIILKNKKINRENEKLYNYPLVTFNITNFELPKYWSFQSLTPTLIHEFFYGFSHK